MTLEKEREKVQRAFDGALQGLTPDPYLARRVLAAQKGEKPKMKKLSVSMILVIALIALTMSVSLAAGLGLFGELSRSDQTADERLDALEDASETVSVRIATADGITLEIGQAYYEGSRVFISYRLSGNLCRFALHEGAPEGDFTWDVDEEHFIFGRQMGSDNPIEQDAIRQLDGNGQRWLEEDTAALHDGLSLLDGTYLQIIGGDDVYQPDGSVIGWKECEIPQDKIADVLDFKAVLFRGHSVLFQDGDHFRRQYTRGESTDLPFTLRRNDRLACLTGETKTGGYAASADFVLGKIDLKGTVRVTGQADWAKAWTAWEAEEGMDMIVNWKLYRGDTLIDENATESIWSAQDDLVCFGLLSPAPVDATGLRLVPEYSQSGERMEEAIELHPVIGQ